MKYNGENQTIEMSVRELCALAMKHGDIDSRFPPLPSSLLEGAEIHRTLQKEAGGYYNPEVPLEATVLHEGIHYFIRGRADGIIRAPEGLIVDEIKCVRQYEFIQVPNEKHLGQLKCYAYFLCQKEGLSSVRARLTYYSPEKKKLRYFHFTYKRDALAAFYRGLLEKVKFFAELCISRETTLRPAAKQAVFPYRELRDGQEMMIRESFGAIKRGERLFVEAPTGTGKTISSLFPALRAFGYNYIDRIFYLTAKASVRREAYAGASRLFSAGVGIRAVVLSAKEQMCALPCACGAKNRCNPVECERARGYYDRVNEALRDLLSSCNGYPQRTVRQYADKYMLCPYELSLDLSEYCDIIICDYNYAFDPSVYLRRYFSDAGKRERYAFLIDEAHNLADRARDMYSAELRRSDFYRAAEALGERDSFIVKLYNAFRTLRTLCKNNIVKDADGNERGFVLSRSPIPDLLPELELFRRRCDTFLHKHPEYEHYDSLYSLCATVRKYLCINEYFDKGCLCYVEISDGDILLKTYCLDPAKIMDKLLCRAKSAVLFSATLTPADYFCNVLGCTRDTYSVTLPSPFDPERLSVTVVDGFSTRYEDREANCIAFVSLIAATAAAHRGNYIAYLPSYDCLEMVYKIFRLKYPNVKTVVQKRNMNASERDKFLSSFKADEGVTRIGFCVLGGVFSEGVDLPGSRLIGTVIFGVGLPGLSNERNIIKDYYDEDAGVGYDYAYTFPGMNNVLQAAGRVIRTESDMGVVVLVDDRYATPTYRRLFSAHWKGVQYAGNAASLAEILRRFWQSKG